ncbi:MAG: hypothetical protein GF333_04790 [Candidatus Omnitrophica bacterium]|nr:hypothetical protein [Candidatus Omnitrophota bacterium]
MSLLSRGIENFLLKQHFVVVSSITSDWSIHCSAKGIGYIEDGYKIYLLDLYLGRTFRNLKQNPVISITAVDEHQFRGYVIKGRAHLIDRHNIPETILRAWDERVTQRISARLIRNVQRERNTQHHPESQFPRPQYVIEMDAEEVIDLTPPDLKSSPGQK